MLSKVSDQVSGMGLPASARRASWRPSWKNSSRVPSFTFAVFSFACFLQQVQQLHLEPRFDGFELGKQLRRDIPEPMAVVIAVGVVVPENMV